MEATTTKVTFQKYPAYKDSGVEWLGEIPEHWENVPGLRFIYENKSKNTGMIRNTVLSLSYGKIRVKQNDELTGLVPESFETYQLVNKGDLIFRPTDLQNDKVSLRSGISEFEGIITNAYLNLRFKNIADSKYYHYVFRTLDNNKVIYGLGSGLRQNINFRDFRRFQFPFPPLQEQTAIAKFLDDKTGKIDLAIAQKEKMIALLKERKQIVIQNAVTKGLDPNAKMKDSGVEWIGEIPEGWEVLPGLRFFRENKRSNKGMQESTVLSLSYGNIIIKPEEKLVGLVPESFETYQIVEPGDIIIRCTDLQNDQTSLRTGLAKNKGIITSAYINLGIIGENHPEYLHAYLHFIDITKVLYKFGSGLRQNLSFADFKRMPVLKVPYNEQVRIVEFVNQASEKIEQAVAFQIKQIEKLKELKSTLIDSAVTGKIKVSSVQEVKVS